MGSSEKFALFGGFFQSPSLSSRDWNHRSIIEKLFVRIDGIELRGVDVEADCAGEHLHGLPNPRRRNHIFPFESRF